MAEAELTQLGKCIETRLKELNMSKKELAEAMGVSRSLVQAYLYRDVNLPLARIKSLASILQCEPTWLLGFGENTSYTTLSVKSVCVRMIKEINSLSIETIKDIEPLILCTVRTTKKLSSKEETEPESS